MCTYARISLTRSPSRSLFPTGPLSLRACPLFSPPVSTPSRTLRVPPPVLRSSRFHSRYALSSLVRDPAISHPAVHSATRSRFVSLSPPACHRSRRSRAHFFPPTPLFFSSARPRGRRVIFIICYLLRRTPPVCRRVSGAVRPEKPENRGKQKSGRRGASRRAVHLAGGGWYARTVAVAMEKGERNGLAAEGVEKKEKGIAGPAA